MKDTIMFEDAILLLSSSVPVVVKFVKYDKNRKTGGEIREYTVQLIQQKQKTERLNSSGTSAKTKSSNYDHFIRNCNVVVDGHITAAIQRIHLPLMLEIDNKRILL